MAMLLVLMLIVMVSAAGVFAARSTALEVRSAGFFRQGAQTHYVAETGAIASLDEMQQYCAAYVGIMETRAQAAPVPPGLAEAPRQYNFYLDDFTRRLAAPLFAAPGPGMGGRRQEGSLGTGLLAPGFVTTATLVARTSQPMFGFSVGGGRDYEIPVVSMEFTSNGRTQLQGVTDLRNNALGTEAARVIAYVPCL